MSLGAGIFDFMSAGLSVGEKVYPLALPQDAETPALVYRVISETPDYTHSDQQDHTTYTGTRFVFTRLQFDCYGGTYDEAEALADELSALVSGYTGMWGEVEVEGVRTDIRLDDWDSAPAVYRVIQDLIVGRRYLPSS